LRPVSRWTNRNDMSPSPRTKNVQSATMELNTMPASYPAASMLSSLYLGKWRRRRPRLRGLTTDVAGQLTCPANIWQWLPTTRRRGRARDRHRTNRTCPQDRPAPEG
jgi:hypothetical protein